MKVRHRSNARVLIIETHWKIGMLSAFMAFIEQGDEVIIFEPFFDQSALSICYSGVLSTKISCNRYISNIEMPGGTIRYVPLLPPKDGGVRTSSASQWTIDFEQLEKTINPKTRMIVCPAHQLV